MSDTVTDVDNPIGKSEAGGFLALTGQHLTVDI